MNKILFALVVSALLVSGCSDKDDPVTHKTEPAMLEEARESAHAAMSGIKYEAGKAMDGAGDMASSTADTVGDAARDAMDGASDMASSAKGAVVAAASDVKEAAGEMVSDAVEAVGEMSDDADEGGGNDPETAGEMDDGGAAGQQVYRNSCQSCHAIGVAGAPKLGDKAAWAPRIATGIDALLASSINGKNVMPPRGACASCSDDDLKAAVLYMVSQGK